MSTPQKILNLLNREGLSVSELASRLDISRNSVYVQITKLESEGSVEKVRREPANRVGKPAFQYRVKPGHEDAYSLAYKPVLVSLFEAMGTRVGKSDRERILEDAGSVLAKSTGLNPTDDFDGDLQRAIDAVNTLGAMAERVDADDAAPGVTCHTCPIASLVHLEPSACNMVARFFTVLTARRVTVRCRHEENVTCSFSFESDEEEAP